MRLGFVTNNAARTPDEVAEHLTALRRAGRADDVITSSQAAATVVAGLLRSGARGSCPSAAPGVAAALTAAGLAVVERAEDGPAAVVQGYGREVGWPQLAEAVVAVRNGARHVATNLDATIPSPRGPLPGNGAMVGVVSAVTGSGAAGHRQARPRDARRVRPAHRGPASARRRRPAGHRHRGRPPRRRGQPARPHRGHRSRHPPRRPARPPAGSAVRRCRRAC